MVSVSGGVEYKPFSNQAAITVGIDSKSASVEGTKPRQAPAANSQNTGQKPADIREERKPDVEFHSRAPTPETSLADSGSSSSRGSVLDVQV